MYGNDLFMSTENSNSFLCKKAYFTHFHIVTDPNKSPNKFIFIATMFYLFHPFHQFYSFQMLFIPELAFYVYEVTHINKICTE